LRGRVVFAGFAEGEWKQTLLQGSDVFVLPSYSESFAIAVMEALAAGLPVVTTEHVPMALLVKKFDLGWVCHPELESLRDTMWSALRGLNDLEAVSKRRQRSAQLIAGNFAWDGIAKQMQSVYRAVVTRSSLPTFELRDIDPHYAAGLHPSTFGLPLAHES
jgi:glycosyltransferase involved in cell wall biosynthesis